MSGAGYRPTSWLQRTVKGAVGFSGRRNILAWGVAGGLAYYFYVVPEKQRAEEQRLARELAYRLAEEKGTLDVDRRAPRPDLQDTGLIKGVK